MEHKEKLILISVDNLAAMVQRLEIGNEIIVEVHNKKYEESQELGFVVSKIDFFDSELFLIGGYGLYTMSLSANNGIEFIELENLIEAWLEHQGLKEFYLKIRLEIIVE